MIAEAHRVIDRHANQLAIFLADARTVAFLTGEGQVASKVRRRTTSLPDFDLPGPTADEQVYGNWTWNGYNVWLPLVDKATETLQSRQLVTREEYDQLSAVQRQNAFTVAYLKKTEALETVRDAILAAEAEGTGYVEFRKRLKDSLWTSSLGPGHMENVFRTSIGNDYSAGMDKILAVPVVDETFPYERRIIVNDSRVSDLCYTVANSGIQGTAIYRRDDPVFQHFKPLSHWKCRCGRRPMTVREAAEAGIREAIQWLKTGLAPAVPAYVPWPVDPKTKGPLQLPPGWTSRD